MEKNIDDYKAIIINGVNDKGDIDGNIDFIGNIDDYDFHVDCLIDYGIEKYPDSQIFKVIPNNCEPNVPVYFLCMFNNVVYLNVSSSRYGKRGILFLPDEISDKQKLALEKISELLANINVDIVYNMRFDDGLVYTEEFDSKRGFSFKEVLDDFYNMVYQDSSKADNEKKPRN